MNNIKLSHLLHIPETDYSNIKIRFNQFSGKEEPLQLYINDPEEVNTRFFLWRGKQKFFNVGEIAMCFLKLSDDLWLLTTIKRITKDLNVTNGINYEAEELEEYKPYYGRVVIKFHRTFQTQVRRYESICDHLLVSQILPSVYDGEDFPGYDKVRLSYSQLYSIFSRGKKDWMAALENQKAVYLITDKYNGKLYVGSATSNKGMLLDRWKNYIYDGHGGNIELKMLIQEKGFEYVKEYFQYSILENYNSKIDDRIILERESWWKETLQSKTFGYNGN